mmetsp:Transcript_25040/g.45345  ORF Transcript_25040/g.45345 Transcript_25040/m.45345 type:complete len:140 (-) Transcript_25040:457-876(-)|eukprot:CAMPEP_0198290976 /NCGR_PEP_ID=MMETSP1449-20131203/8646_1 /TAXON_ID=420275 /ORGANISM="Attheya septentrionalis, Strain CCMP2084" /LENGTH=139 /DNA_ID=CAMNT_0043989551 /DNA_START=93 /DNA_END=512 /DNA_ORIENTATION=+
MKSMYSSVILVVVACMVSSCVVVSGFAPTNFGVRRSAVVSMQAVQLPAADLMSPMPTTTSTFSAAPQFTVSPSATALDQGVQSFVTSSSNVVSLKERVVPTAEEIAAKKNNFNAIFWGGGFVAPFLATFYYFGLKFWER